MDPPASTKRPLFFRSKYELFRRNHERLQSAPDPQAAQGWFLRRLKQARRVQRLRIACYIGIYFGAVAASLAAVLDVPLIQAVSALTATLAGLFFLGVLACNRLLGLLDVELYFRSSESRLAAPPGAPGFT